MSFYSCHLHCFLVFKFLLIIYFYVMGVLSACMHICAPCMWFPKRCQSSGARVTDGWEPCVHWEQSEARSLARAISPASQGFLFVCLFNVFSFCVGKRYSMPQHVCRSQRTTPRSWSTVRPLGPTQVTPFVQQASLSLAPTSYVVTFIHQPSCLLVTGLMCWGILF